MNRIKIKAENDEYQIIQYLKLNRIKRNKLQEIFIEGIECIKQAIKSDIEITRIITRDIKKLSNWGKDVVEKYADVKIIEMSGKLYNELSDKTDPSEMLITAKVKHNSINDIKPPNPFLIVFDRPSDHGNFGSIIRSANAFNADSIFIVGHGIDIYDPKVIRASLGSIFFTKIAAVESMELFMEYVKTQKKINNMEVIGTDSAGDVSAADYKIMRPVLVILGNEAKGMSKNLKDICDRIIRIPIQGNVNSLNVSCAASIIMWEIFKDEC